MKSWQKVIGYGICITVLFAALWKVGALRALPSFASNIVSIIPSSLISESTKATVKESAPMPSLGHTVDTLLETPLTVGAIATGTGILILGVGSLKLVAMILSAFRHVPK